MVRCNRILRQLLRGFGFALLLFAVATEFVGRVHVLTRCLLYPAFFVFGMLFARAMFPLDLDEYPWLTIPMAIFAAVGAVVKVAIGLELTKQSQAISYFYAVSIVDTQAASTTAGPLVDALTSSIALGLAFLALVYFGLLGHVPSTTVEPETLRIFGVDKDRFVLAIMGFVFAVYLAVVMMVGWVFSWMYNVPSYLMSRQEWALLCYFAPVAMAVDLPSEKELADLRTIGVHCRLIGLTVALLFSFLWGFMMVVDDAMAPTPKWWKTANSVHTVVDSTLPYNGTAYGNWGILRGAVGNFSYNFDDTYLSTATMDGVFFHQWFWFVTSLLFMFFNLAFVGGVINKMKRLRTKATERISGVTTIPLVLINPQSGVKVKPLKYRSLNGYVPV